MLRKIGRDCLGALVFCAATAVPNAEDEKPVWHGPFGGTFSAGATFATDYSYRGISQTQRQVAFQPTSPTRRRQSSENASRFRPMSEPGPATFTSPAPAPPPRSISSAASAARRMNDKLTFDLGYIRYNYLGLRSGPAIRLQRVRPRGRLRFRARRDQRRGPLQPQLLRQFRHRLVQVGAGRRAAALHQVQLFNDPVAPSCSARSAASMSSATSTTAFPTTTIGTGSSAPPSPSMASI